MNLEEAYKVYHKIQNYGVMGLESARDESKPPNLWEISLALGHFHDRIKELEAKLILDGRKLTSDFIHNGTEYYEIEWFRLKGLCVSVKNGQIVFESSIDVRSRL